MLYNKENLDAFIVQRKLRDIKVRMKNAKPGGRYLHDLARQEASLMYKRDKGFQDEC